MIGSIAVLVARAAAAVLMVACIGWTAYGWGFRFIPRGRPCVRWAAATVVAWWTMALSFWLLLAIGWFHWIPAGMLWIAASAGTHQWITRRRSLRRRFRADVAHLRRAVRGLNRPVAVAAVLLGAVASWRIVRGLAAPPLGWDALTYHLVKAARWVQSGSLAPQPAPDAWSYYEYFPPVGDLYWAWTLLPLNEDTLLVLMGAWMWLGAILGIHAAARELDARRSDALGAALAVAALPASLCYLSSGYVDNLVLALFSLGCALLIHAYRQPQPCSLVLAMASFGLAVGVKPTAAPMFVMAAVVSGFLLLRNSARTRADVWIALGCVVAPLVASPGYLRAWIERGSPLYPLGVTVFGHQVAAGNESLASLAAARGPMAERLALDAQSFWAYVLIRPAPWDGSFVNPGPFLPILALVGLAGLVRLWVRPGRRLVAVLLSFTVVTMVWALSSENMALFRTTLKVTTAGRYFLLAFAALAIAGATVPWKGLRWLWLIGVVMGTALAVPRAWSDAEVAGAWAIAALTVAMGALVATVGWRRAQALPLVTALLATTWIVGVTLVRRPLRHAVYRATVEERPLFHMHSLDTKAAAAHVLWRSLDRAEPLRLAVAAGWDGLGHNWYRYPLFGTQLQNVVEYIPVSTDGSIIDYRERARLASEADWRAWLSRLLQHEIDYFVVLQPRTTIEDFWIQRRPEVFQLIASDPGQQNAAYRIDPIAARRALQQK